MVIDLGDNGKGDSSAFPSLVTQGFSKAVTGDFPGDMKRCNGLRDDPPGSHTVDGSVMLPTVGEDVWTCPVLEEDFQGLQG